MSMRALVLFALLVCSTVSGDTSPRQQILSLSSVNHTVAINSTSFRPLRACSSYDSWEIEMCGSESYQWCCVWPQHCAGPYYMCSDQASGGGGPDYTALIVIMVFVGLLLICIACMCETPECLREELARTRGGF